MPLHARSVAHAQNQQMAQCLSVRPRPLIGCRTSSGAAGLHLHWHSALKPSSKARSGLGPKHEYLCGGQIASNQ